MKYIYLLLFIFNLSLFAKESIDLTISKNNQYTQNFLFKDFNGNFKKIIHYNNELFQNNKQKELFDFNIKLINAMIEKYGEDSEYVYISYLFLARYYIAYSEYDIAKSLLSFTNEIKENKKFEHDDVIQYIIYTTKASYAEGIGDIKESYSLYQSAYKLNKKIYINNVDTRLHILNPLARISLSLSKIDESVKYVKEAMNIAKNNTNVDSLCLSMDTFLNYANIYKSIEDYKKSLQIYTTAISLYEGTKKIMRIDNDSLCIVEVYTEYANQLVSIGIYADAIKTSEKSLALLGKLGISDSLFNINNLNIIAYAKKETEHYEEAKKFYTKALNLIDIVTTSQKIKNKYKIMIEEAMKETEKLKINKNRKRVSDPK